MSAKAKLQNKLAILVAETHTLFTMTTTSVGTSATAIPVTAKTNRKGILVQNKHGVNVVYLGGSGVTADDASTGGYELAPGDAVFLPLDGSVDLYAIASGATTAVGTMEFAD